MMVRNKDSKSSSDESSDSDSRDSSPDKSKSPKKVTNTAAPKSPGSSSIKNKRKHDHTDKESSEDDVTSGSKFTNVSPKKKSKKSVDLGGASGITSPKSKSGFGFNTTNSSVDSDFDDVKGMPSGSELPNGSRENQNKGALVSATQQNKRGRPLKDLQEKDLPDDVLRQIFAKMRSELPDGDCHKYSYHLDRFNWEVFKVGEYDAKECENGIKRFLSKVRLYRTMFEVLDECELRLQKPMNQRFTSRVLTELEKQMYPDMPNRPRPVFIQFYTANLPRYRDMFPDASLQDYTAMASEEYKIMPTHEIAMHKAEYKKEMEKYKTEMAEFKKSHPDYEPRDHSQRKQIAPARKLPVRAKSAADFWVEFKMKKHADKDEDEKKELIETYHKRYEELPDEKKQKYVDRAADDETRFTEEMKKYCESINENSNPSKWSVKTNRKRRERAEGLPARPARGGYSAFSRRFMVCGVTVQEVGRRWRAMSDSEKQKYTDMGKKDVAEFNETYAAFLNTLPEDKRAQFQKTTGKRPAGCPVKPNGGAYGIYVRDTLKTVSATFKGGERLKEVGRRWQLVPADQKLEYQIRFAQESALYEEKLAEYLDALPDHKRYLEEIRLKRVKSVRPRPPRRNRVNMVVSVSPQDVLPPASKVSAIALYQEAKLAEAMEAAPGKSQQDILMDLAIEYSQLTDKKKEKYKRRALKAKEEEEAAQTIVSTANLADDSGDDIFGPSTSNSTKKTKKKRRDSELSDASLFARPDDPDEPSNTGNGVRSSPPTNAGGSVTQKKKGKGGDDRSSPVSSEYQSADESHEAIGKQDDDDSVTKKKKKKNKKKKKESQS